jgi:hypothetical protein
MSKTLDLDPQDGEELSDWASRLIAGLEELQLLPTNEVSFDKSAGGVFIRLLPKGADYLHPFKPTLDPSGLRLRKGTVQAGAQVAPSVKGQPEPQDAAAADFPALTLDPAQMDAATLTSWAVLEIEAGNDGTLSVDEKGRLADGQRCEIVHSARPDACLADKPGVGRQPLAQILWMGGVPAYAFACVHHNLQYARTFPADGQGLPRHFFWAV